MRTFPNSRGLPPKLLSTTRHLWLFDQSSTSADARDICGYGGNPLNLTQVSTPALSNAWGAAGGRTLDGSADYFATADGGGSNDFSAMGYSYISALISFRLGAGFTTRGCLVSYGADWADYQYLLAIHINANRNIEVYWGNGATWIAKTFTTPILRAGRRYQIGVVSDRAANTVKLYVNGALVETKTGVTDPSVASATLTWRAGATLTTTPTHLFNGELYAIRIDCSESAAPTLADFREDFRRAQQFSTETSSHMRARVKDYNGTYRNLADFLGNSWFAGASISDDADQNCVTASVNLFRAAWNYSLAKYHDNRVNRPGDYAAVGPSGSYQTDGSEDLLNVNREILLEFARVPLGSTPGTTDWQSIFHGYVDKVDWGDDIIQLDCRDQGAILLDGYIEDTCQFPTNGVDHSLAATIYDGGSGHGILDKADTENWIAVSASSIGLIEPVASGINITAWYQERQPILPVIVGLAEQIGWLCRYRWSDADDDFKLTLYEPARTREYEDVFITAGDYKILPTLTVDKADIRNIVRVVFASASPGANPATAGSYGGWGSDSENNAGQYFVEVSATDLDPTYDFTKYNRQFGEMVEGSGVNITTYEQAEKWAIGVCRDLMEPTALCEARMFAFPEIECEDILYFDADGHHTTVDFRLATYSLTHNFSVDNSETTVTLRGRPSGGSRRHLSREVRTSGACAPVMVKDDLRIAVASRMQRTAKFSVFEKSGLVKTANVATTINKQFQSVLCGVNYPPDGWEVTAGTWGIDFDLDTTQATRGKYCLRIIT